MTRAELDSRAAELGFELPADATDDQARSAVAAIERAHTENGSKPSEPEPELERDPEPDLGREGAPLAAGSAQNGPEELTPTDGSPASAPRADGVPERPETVDHDASTMRRPFEVLTARELCELPEPAAEVELVGPLVIRGARTIVGGHTGEGKTSFALQAFRALLRGESFLDWSGSGASSGRALVLDLEQGLRSVQRRLRERGLDDCEELDYVRVPDGLALDRNQEHTAAVESLLAEKGYAAVLLDPLYKAHAGDSNAEREAVDLMRLLDSWRVAYGFALVLPVHCRKPIPGSKFTIHDIFGSSAYVRGAEIVVGLQRIANGVGRLHFLKARDGDLPVGEHRELLFTREDGFWLKPEHDVDAEIAELRPKIVDFVSRHPGCSQRRVEEGVGGKAAHVRAALRALVETQEIDDRGSGSRKEFHASERQPLSASPEELDYR